MFPALTLVFAALLQSPPEPVHISVGDTVRVEIFGFREPMDHKVLPDGSISGAPYGRVVIAGKTVEEASALIVAKSKKYINNPVVFVTIKEQSQKFVFLVGVQASTESRVPWQSSLDLRSVAVVAQTADSADLWEMRVFRNGVELVRSNVRDLLAGVAGAANPKLQPNDVVSLLPVEQIRVWVLDKFADPGEFTLPKGANLAQVMARAGGPMINPPQGVEIGSSRYEKLARVQVFRGGKTLTFSPDDKESLAEFNLQAGDTISFVTPSILSVSVAGSVVEPGKFSALEGTDVLEVITAAKGPTETGTLSGVLVARKGEVFRVDLTKRYQGEPGGQFLIQDQDLIIVPENERAMYVLGEVNKPGKFLLKDNQKLFAADVVAMAGGINDKASFRRMMLARVGENGKYEVIQFNLDEFLKDGKKEANPEILPGDFLLVTPSKGITVETFIQLLPSALIFDSLRR